MKFLPLLSGLNYQNLAKATERYITKTINKNHLSSFLRNDILNLDCKSI